VRAFYARNRVGLCRVQSRDKHQEAASARPGIASERAFESYSYDLNGNRTSSLNAAGVFAATFDAQDRILTYGNLSFGYTPNGELASKMDTATNETTQYTYDALGNLRSVVLPDGTLIEYLVDGYGRRIGKKVNGTLVKQWLWGGQLQPLAELDGAGNLVTRFVYAGGSNAPAIMETSGTTYRLMTNHLGSVREVVDASSGNVAQEILYDTWGRVLFDSNPGFQPFGFAGGMYEPETRLVRFGARDYDAEIGRWTSRDPIGLSGGLNISAYAADDPTNYVDITGLDVGVPHYSGDDASVGAEDVCEYECLSGMEHKFVVFNNDPSRAYGFWPNYKNAVPPFSFNPGQLNTHESSYQSPLCNQTAWRCYSVSPQQAAEVEDYLRETYTKRPYFVPIVDCNSLMWDADRMLAPQPSPKLWQAPFAFSPLGAL
jgi:RHS repeat-associated protein